MPVVNFKYNSILLFYYSSRSYHHCTVSNIWLQCIKIQPIDNNIYRSYAITINSRLTHFSYCTTIFITSTIIFFFTVEVTNRFKGLDLVPELWMKVRDIVQEAVIKTIPEKKTLQKGKMVV